MIPTEYEMNSGYESTIILIVIVILFLAIWISRYYWKRRHFFRMAGRIPGLKNASSLVYTMEIVLCSFDDLLGKIYKTIRDNPEVFKVWFAHKLFVSITKPEHIEAVLLNKNCLEKDKFYHFFKSFVGEGIFTAPVKKWKKHRKLLNPTFHSKQLNNFVPVFCEKSDILIEILEKTATDPDFDIHTKFSACTTDAICETAMGIDIKAQTSSIGYGRNLEKLCEMFVIRMANPLYHIRFVYDWFYGKIFEETRRSLHKFARKILDEQKVIFKQKLEAIEDGTYIEDGESMKSFLKLLLEVSHKTGHLTDREVQDEVNTMIAAGAGTTATCLSLCSIMLALHPEYQQKVYEESIEILGEERDVTAEDIPKFQFLEMCIKETLRILPVAPFVARIAMADIELDNLIIPKGSTIIISIINLHRDPEVWKDPLKFDPYRFQAETFAKCHPYSFLPFLGGPRNCIGRNYAYIAVKAIMAKVIRRFEFKTTYKRIEDIDLKMNITSQPVHGWQVRVERRN